MSTLCNLSHIGLNEPVYRGSSSCTSKENGFHYYNKHLSYISQRPLLSADTTMPERDFTVLICHYCVRHPKYPLSYFSKIYLPTSICNILLFKHVSADSSVYCFTCQRCVFQQNYPMPYLSKIIMSAKKCLLSYLSKIYLPTKCLPSYLSKMCLLTKCVLLVKDMSANKVSTVLLVKDMSGNKVCLTCQRYVCQQQGPQPPVDRPVDKCLRPCTALVLETPEPSDLRSRSRPCHR